MNKCQEIGGKRTKVKRIAEVYTCRRDVFPMVTNMFPCLCQRYNQRSIGVHACVCESIVTIQLYATLFSNFFCMFSSELGQTKTTTTKKSEDQNKFS